MVLETERYPKDKTLRWRLVYQSDFTEPTGWDEEHSDKVKLFRLDGYYHIAIDHSPWSAWFNPPIIVDDFRAQVDAELNSQSGETAACGLIFSTNGDDAVRMSAKISRNGFYSLHREGKGFKAILDWKKSELLKLGDKTNLLMLERLGDKVTLGINNYIVATATVSGLTRGTVGLFVRAYEGDAYAEAMFKNFLLYSVYRKLS